MAKVVMQLIVRLKRGTHGLSNKNRVNKRSLCPQMSTDASSQDVTSGLDATQVALLREECILVDEQDRAVGGASKKTCHLLANINNGVSLCAVCIQLTQCAHEVRLCQKTNTCPWFCLQECCTAPSVSFSSTATTNSFCSKDPPPKLLFQVS